MSVQALLSADIYQRRLDILGVAKNVSVSSAQFGQTSLIFTTGNIGYPSPAGRTFVAYLVVEFSAGAPPINTFVALGAGNTGGTDGSWNLSLSLDPNLIGFNPPYVFSAGMGNPNTGSYHPPIYPAGVPFVVRNQAINPTATLATFTAVGWSS